MGKMLALVGLCCFGLLVGPGIASADWAENFDSYALGSGLHGQGGWRGWDGNPAADAYVSDAFAHSSPHSVSITAASDIVQAYSGYSTGLWIFTAWVYVPTDFSGTSYFLLLNTYGEGGPYNWSNQVSFVSASNTVVSEPELASLPLILGQWVELRVEIDLVADRQIMYYDNQMLYDKSWTDGISGDGALNIACVDLYANNASPVYYDDMSLTGSEPPNPVQNTSWGRVKQLFE